MTEYKCLFCDNEGDYCNCWNFAGTQTVFVCDEHFIQYIIEYKKRLEDENNRDNKNA